MNKYCSQWIQEWCHENGWTDLFVVQRDYWAFPPHAVMPTPIPAQVLHGIKAEKGLSPAERLWYGAACGVTLLMSGLSYLADSPMPLVVAFAFCAVVVALSDDD